MYQFGTKGFSLERREVVYRDEDEDGISGNCHQGF